MGLAVGRWSIYIDLEGFGNLYDKENQVLVSLEVLMEGIFQIGCCCYPESPDCLFAHQLGDGFVIVSEFPEDMLDRPIAIALALLRHVAHSGRFAKASVSEGEFADIRSCYPASVLDASTNDGRIRLGRGVMTLFPVMGSRPHSSIFGDQKLPKRAFVGRCISRAKAPSGRACYL
jgi:hypothetical protein